MANGRGYGEGSFYRRSTDGHWYGAVDVAVFLHEKLKAGLAVRTVARLRTVLGTALGHAVLLGHQQRNVALLVRPPRGTIDRGRSLTLGQARELLRAASGDRFLPAQVVASLERRRVVQTQERVRAGRRWEDTDLVFTTRARATGGAPQARCSPRSDHRTSRRGRWHPHELRHSAVSLLSAAGVRLEDVADVMGHRSTRTTSAVYRHVVVPTISAGQRPAERLFS